MAEPVRVLLVEDNEMNRDMLTRRLARRGFAVESATDGAEAVTRAAASLPDVVLMDLNLPVLDGYDATRQLKESPATGRIPVIALSAHAMSDDRERALAAGCDDFDTKPVDLDRLIRKIDEALGRKTAPA
jgi:CheY-like chemotaxis protein